MRGSQLNLEIYDLLHSTLADEIRDHLAKMKMPTIEEVHPKNDKSEPKIGDLTDGLEDPHNAAESEMHKHRSSNLVNETLLKGQILQSNNVKIVNNGEQNSVVVNKPGVFVNGKRLLKKSADYEYIEQDVSNVDKTKILEDLENSLRSKNN